MRKLARAIYRVVDLANCEQGGEAVKQLKGKVFIGAGVCRVAAGSTVRTKRARKQSRCMNEVWRRVDFNLSTCLGRRCFGRWTRILVLFALYGLVHGVVAYAQRV